MKKTECVLFYTIMLASGSRGLVACGVVAVRVTRCPIFMVPANSRTPRKRNPRGRPRKFHEPSRPITVTLPERTLEILSELGSDRGRAIVAVADSFAERRHLPRPRVEVVQVAGGISVILIGPCPALSEIDALRAIEVSPGRYLLTTAPGTPISALEVELTDLVESGDTSPHDKALLDELTQVLRRQRRRKGIRKAEILFVEEG